MKVKTVCPRSPYRVSKVVKIMKKRALSQMLVSAALVLAASFSNTARASGVLGNEVSLGFTSSKGPVMAAGLASVDPSSGDATSSIPFLLNTARGGVQPTLDLVYNSSSGDREAGLGWGFGLPAIERHNLSGAPTFDVSDRFTFSNQPLVFLCVTTDSTCTSLVDSFPDWAVNEPWRYYRLQDDTMFARFFWSPDGSSWRVQFKNGETMELGSTDSQVVCKAQCTGPSGSVDGWPDGRPRIFRWKVSRRYDAYGAVNAIEYRYTLVDEYGMSYLTDTTSVVGRSVQRRR